MSINRYLFRNKTLKLVLAAGCFLTMCSCGVSRISSTEKSAVERALVAESLQAAIESVDVSELKGKKAFVTEADQLRMGPRVEVGVAQIEGMVKRHILESGAILADNKEEAEVIVDPLLHYAQLDENKMVFGLPAFPVPIAGSVLNTPEFALLGVNEQYGRSKVSLLVTDKDEGVAIVKGESEVAEKTYNRWTLLIFIGWRQTDLPDPF